MDHAWPCCNSCPHTVRPLQPHSVPAPAPAGAAASSAPSSSPAQSCRAGPHPAGRRGAAADPITYAADPGTPCSAISAAAPGVACTCVGTSQACKRRATAASNPSKARICTACLLEQHIPCQHVSARTSLVATGNRCSPLSPQTSRTGRPIPPLRPLSCAASGRSQSEACAACSWHQRCSLRMAAGWQGRSGRNATASCASMDAAAAGRSKQSWRSHGRAVANHKTSSVKGLHSSTLVSTLRAAPGSAGQTALGSGGWRRPPSPPSPAAPAALRPPSSRIEQAGAAGSASRPRQRCQRRRVRTSSTLPSAKAPAVLQCPVLGGSTSCNAAVDLGRATCPCRRRHASGAPAGLGARMNQGGPAAAILLLSCITAA